MRNLALSVVHARRAIRDGERGVSDDNTAPKRGIKRGNRRKLLYTLQPIGATHIKLQPAHQRASFPFPFFYTKHHSPARETLY